MSKDRENEDREDLVPDPPEQAPTTELEIESTEETTPPAASEPATVKKPGRGGIVLGVFAFLLAGGSLAASAWLWLTLQNDQQALDARIGSLEQSVAAVRRTTEAESRRLSAEIERLTDAQRSLKASLDKTRKRVGEDRDQWSLEEIRQLLLLASDQLRLAGNVPGALAALRTADQRIVDSGEPRLASMREQIAQDIASLEQVRQLDLAGISHRLGALEKSIDELPLSTRSSMETATGEPTPVAGARTDSELRAVLQKLGTDLSGLVRIRRIDQPTVPLLPVDQQYFVRENIKLSIHAARIALLRDEDEIYRASLEQARDWIRHYFDGDSRSVQWAVEELGKLAAVETRPVLPDFLRSLQALDGMAGEDDRS